MKRAILFLLLPGSGCVFADPQLSAWYAADSGKYARIYQSTAQATFVIPSGTEAGARNVGIAFSSPGPTYTLSGGITIS